MLSASRGPKSYSTEAGDVNKRFIRPSCGSSNRKSIGSAIGGLKSGP